MINYVQNKITKPSSRCFIEKPWTEKLGTLLFYFKKVWNKISFGMPLPVRLPFGGWYLAWNDINDDCIFAGNYEKSEKLFVESFLKPGMTVLDIGAHHGFYTLLASKKVGHEGRVIAFEPSPREKRKLLWHIKLNHYKNVKVEDVALGNKEGNVEFFVVQGRDTGCNSLLPPKVTEPTRVVEVRVIKLDNYLKDHRIDHVDFIKMDVEGAELSVLKGATGLLQHKPRPVILCELADTRTQSWGYKAKEVVVFLSNLGYYWFLTCKEGTLEPIPLDIGVFDRNFIAVPEEQIDQIKMLFNVNYIKRNSL